MPIWRRSLRLFHILVTTSACIGLILLLRGSGHAHPGEPSTIGYADRPASSQADARPEAKPPKPSTVLVAQAPRPEAPKVLKPEAADTLATRIESLTEKVLKRVDEANHAESQWADQRVTTAFAHNAMVDAKRSLDSARGSETEYETAVYPADRKAIVSSLKFAEEEHKQAVIREEWTARMLKNQMSSEAAHDHAEFEAYRTEQWIADERAKLDKLDKYTRPHKVAEFRAEIARASDEVAARTRAWEREQERESTIEAEARAAALTERELKAMALLKDSDSLIADKNSTAAAAKLKDAESLWSSAVAERADAHRADQRRRLQRALEQPNTPLPPPSPKPPASR
jgi:hypothetical protein